MKNSFLIVSLLLAVSGCKKIETAAKAAKDVRQAPVQYVDGMQQNVKKAEEARAMANQRIQQNTQDINQAMKEAGASQ